jgi:hypothetical protein
VSLLANRGRQTLNKPRLVPPNQTGKVLGFSRIQPMKMKRHLVVREGGGCTLAISMASCDLAFLP